MDASTKDLIAKFLHERYDECRHHTIHLSTFTAEGFTQEETVKTLRRLYALGLLSEMVEYRNSFGVTIAPGLEEFIESGGYTAKQQILELEKDKIEASLQYLQLQIKKCEAMDASLFNHLTTGFNNVVQLLGFGINTLG